MTLANGAIAASPNGARIVTGNGAFQDCCCGPPDPCAASNECPSVFGCFPSSCLAPTHVTVTITGTSGCTACTPCPIGGSECSSDGTTNIDGTYCLPQFAATEWRLTVPAAVTSTGYNDPDCAGTFGSAPKTANLRIGVIAPGTIFAWTGDSLIADEICNCAGAGQHAAFFLGVATLGTVCEGAISATNQLTSCFSAEPAFGPQVHVWNTGGSATARPCC